eukprot:COSAG04_NODE_14821_length_554_cov_0.536264_1_plen_50_part_01
MGVSASILCATSFRPVHNYGPTSSAITAITTGGPADAAPRPPPPRSVSSA